jgi:hypothetical protein
MPVNLPLPWRDDGVPPPDARYATQIYRGFAMSPYTEFWIVDIVLRWVLRSREVHDTP